MDKFVYCHESGSYESVTSLKGSESRIFEALREIASPGTFIYAPTTADKALLFSYTQASGQFRVDGYKGDCREFGTNPATYIGNVKVSAPYYERALGALPCSQTFAPEMVDADRIVSLVYYLIYGNEDKTVVLLGSDIVRRAAEYLKFLFLLFPSAYAQKVGFCINKYIKRFLEDEDKFAPDDEKPKIRIYALDSQSEFADCYKVKLDGYETPPDETEIGVKALKYLIRRGVTRENFTALFRATERAFSDDGRVDGNKYTRCLVRAAFESSHALEYAEAVIGHGFVNDSEKAQFIDAVNLCLESGDKNQKQVAAGKALELLKNDINPVSEKLIKYLFSQKTVSDTERDFLTFNALKQLEQEDTDTIGADDYLVKYLDATAPSWRQKYEFTVVIISRLIADGKRSVANRVCRILSERFKKENLTYAKDFSPDTLFDLGQIEGETQCAVYAALLKNDCTQEKIHNYTRIYFKKRPSFKDIFNVYYKMKEIFEVEFSECDFIFGDNDCERMIKNMIGQIGFLKLQESYHSLAAMLNDYVKIKALFFTEMLRADKLREAGESLLEAYESFTDDTETEIKQMGGIIGRQEESRLEEARKECKAFIGEKGNALSAQQKIDEFCGDYLQKLYRMLPERQQEEVRKNVAAKEESQENDTPQFDHKKVIDKYGSNNFKMHSGKRGINFVLLFALLSGLIACLITFIPAIYLAETVGNFMFAAFSSYLSRYFYVAVSAPVVAVLLYFVLYFFVTKRREKVAFGITALCFFIPCLFYGLGYILSYLILT